MPGTGESQRRNGEVSRGTSGKILSLEDIRELLSKLAVDGEGAQQTQAARLLMSMSAGGDSVLPDPLTPAEAMMRMIRLMRGFGQRYCRLAYCRAFPRRIDIKKLRLDQSDAEAIGADPANFPRSLKQLYRRYPEISQRGFPKGYPVQGSTESKQEWCRNEAYKIERDRMNAKTAEAQISLEEERRRGGKTEGPASG